MSKTIKIALIVLVLLACSAGIAFWVLIKSVEPEIPEPVSDVPVTYKIGWWSYQEQLKVDSLQTKLIYEKLNLFNSKAVIQYSIEGTISYKNGWRPYIKSVFISERWSRPPANFNGNLADISVIPIIGVESDDDYKGDEIPYSVNVQDYLSSGGWGMNKYIIKSQLQESIVEIRQRK